MDFDLDVDMEDASAPYAAEVDPYAGAGETAAHDAAQDDILPIDVDDAQEPGEIDETAATATATAASGATAGLDATPVPHKVHLRGLDTFTPADIKAYVAEHTGTAGGSGYDRVEWIDDSSANLVFASESAATAALAALCALPIDDPAQLPAQELLPAKPYTAKPEAGAGLQVRFAVAADKKQAGAAARSRFYLLHPEYDPEERRQQRQRQSSYRDRDRDRDRDRGYRSRYRSDRDDRDDRDRDTRNNSFDVSLYDDDADALAKRGSLSRSRSRSSRSSSRPSSSRRRRSSPPPRRNRDKELFPSRGKELFPTKGKELFPDKLGSGGGGGVDRDRDRTRDRNRSGRLSQRDRDRSASPIRYNNNGGNDYDKDDDYDGRLADERATATAAAAARNRDKARAIRDRLSSSASSARDGSGNSNSNSGGARELFPTRMGSTAQMDLMDRRSGADAVTARLSGAATTTAAGDPTDSTFSIRGLASQQRRDGGGGHGLSIKGAATARELFPDKFGSSSNSNNNSNNSSARSRNAGKEIFSDKLENRIRPRQRAEDLFH